MEVEWCGAVSKSKGEIYKGKENVSDTGEYKGKAEEWKRGAEECTQDTIEEWKQEKKLAE